MVTRERALPRRAASFDRWTPVLLFRHNLTLAESNTGSARALAVGHACTHTSCTSRG